MQPASAPSRNRSLGGFLLIASTPGLYPRSKAATWLATLETEINFFFKILQHQLAWSSLHETACDLWSTLRTFHESPTPLLARAFCAMAETAAITAAASSLCRQLLPTTTTGYLASAKTCRRKKQAENTGAGEKTMSDANFYTPVCIDKCICAIGRFKKFKLISYSIYLNYLKITYSPFNLMSIKNSQVKNLNLRTTQNDAAWVIKWICKQNRFKTSIFSLN